MSSLAETPRMDVADVREHLMVMGRQEERFYRGRDYLHSDSSLCARDACPTARLPEHLTCGPTVPAPARTENTRRRAVAVDTSCRLKMCEWFYQVVDFCKLSRDTVSYTMSYLDRFLGTEAGRPHLESRTMFQLSAVTCFYMAIKIHEPVEIEMSLLSILSRGCYTERQIAEMESRILMALDWHVHPPIAMAYVDLILSNMVPTGVHSTVVDEVYEIARYQVELSVIDYRFVKHYSSVVALAAILNAVEHMDEARFAVEHRHAFFRVLEGIMNANTSVSDDIREARGKLLGIFAKSRGYELFDSALLSSSGRSDVAWSHQQQTREEGALKSTVDHQGSPVCISRQAMFVE